MSTEIGGKDAARAMLDESKALFEAAQVEERQLELLDPLTPEELAEAQEDLGPNAGNLAVVRHAREKRRGRPKGSRNRRTDDFEAYIRQHGCDPAVTLMQIQSTQPEVLMERSRILDGAKKRMSYGEAQALRVRCAEALMPHLHSKKPVAVDHTVRGVLVQEQIGDVRRVGSSVIDGEVIGVAIEDGEGGR